MAFKNELLIFGLVAICQFLVTSTLEAKSDSARQLLDNRQWTQAERAYSELLKKNPKDPIALNNRGFAKHRLGKYEEAIKDYGKALKLRPNWNVALNNRGRALRHLKRFEEAQNNFTEAIEQEPDNVHGWNNRGRTWADLGSFQKGIDDLTRAICLDPDYPYPYYNRGICFRALKKDALADADFEKALNLGYPKERVEEK